MPSAPRSPIGGIPFKVVGILQAKGGTSFQSGDDQILIPVSTLKRYFTGSASSGVRSIGVSVADAGQMETVKADITALLEQRHDIAADGDRRLLASPTRPSCCRPRRRSTAC